jgi:PAS domain S-box-containing protein
MAVECTKVWGGRQLGQVLDGLPDFVVLLDRELRLLYANRYALRILGRPEKELAGESIWELFPHLRETLAWEELPRVVASGAEATFDYYSSLTGRWLQARVFCVDDAVVLHNTDLSEAYAAKERLRGSEGQLRLALSAAELGTWDVELESGVTRFSGKAARVFRRGEGEFTITRAESMNVLHPEDLPRVQRALEALILRDEPYHVEFRAHESQGNWRWVEAGAMAVRDAEGKALRVIGVFADVTDRKEAEAELERRVAERTAQLEAARRSQDSWNYSVSHDLRAPLRAVMSTARVLQLDHAEELSPAAQAHLQRQVNAAKKLGDLIDELLAASRLANQDLAMAKLDLSAIAREVADEHLRACDKSFYLRILPGMSANGDPCLVRLVLSNFIENAMKYSPAGSTITVGQEGGAFYVRDQGIGFEMRYEPKIWRPFERLVLDSDYVGTGIGLYNVAQMLARMGGRAWAESVPGEGSTFWFTVG